MAVESEKVIIKGQKDGLHFMLDEKCDFGELITELEYKLAKTHTNILTGPVIHVLIKTGQRVLSEEQQGKIRQALAKQGNLIIQGFEHDKTPDSTPSSFHSGLKIIKGVVRSGQTISESADILYLGDINPGGNIRSTGSIIIMGALRGVAHAGTEGDQQAIIAASYLKPTQLRIAEQISRPPDEWEHQDAYMEFAYLKDQQMKIEKLSLLHRIRPEIGIYKGE